MWKAHTPYRDLGAYYYEQRNKERLLDSMKKKAKQIGYLISVTPLP
jgi:hypothetical protein